MPRLAGSNRTSSNSDAGGAGGSSGDSSSSSRSTVVVVIVVVVFNLPAFPPVTITVLPVRSAFDVQYLRVDFK